MKKILGLIILLMAPIVLAQSTVSIHGKLTDSVKNPLEAVTVYVVREKDNSVLEYSMSNAEGNFDLKVKMPEEKVLFKASMLGFKPYVKALEPTDKTTYDLGTIQLKELITNLDELVIQADIPPIRVKKDTLEFNASSFSVRPDANLEQLLKQLPGFQMDENKKITINGKEVNEILVNGKPFFGEDGKIALENLPAEIINKVQVTDQKTKKEKFTGERAKSDHASINITIEEENNRGYFGKLTGGYGSDERYEGSLFFNTFFDKTQLNVIGSANNINAMGFSMDEVFDNMRMGRSSGGITASRMLGVNFVQDLSSKLKVNGSYNYNFSDNESKNRSTVTQFLPSGEFTNNSESGSNSDSEGHSANVSIDYIGEKDSFYIMPSFQRNYSNSSTNSSDQALNEAGELLNDSESQAKSKGESNSFSNAMRYMRKLKRDRQFFTVEFLNSNGVNTSDILQESVTNFYKSEQEVDIRRQYQQQNNSNDSYTLSFEYSQPVTDSLTMLIGNRWDRNQTITDAKVFDFNEATQGYTDLNTLQTNRYLTVQTTVAPYVGFNFTHKKFNADFNTSTQIVKNNVEALYNNQLYALDKKYIDPNVRLNLRYLLSRGNFFFFTYNYNVTYQRATELLDIVDVSNPLHTFVGNPDLRPTGNHSFNASYRSYNFQTRSGYSLYGNINLLNNSIVSAVDYDEDRKSISTYKNVSGAYNWSLNGSWYRSSKWDEIALRYGVNLRYNHSVSKGYIDGVTYDALSNSLSPRVYASFDYDELVRISPSYNYTTNWSSYKNFNVDRASTYTHNAALEAILYWPSKFTIGNDFSYTYNSQIASGYNRDFYMWNISLAYEFFGDRFKAKVKVYDVLNQNTSSRRTIDATSIVDSESLVLKRYVMFSLTYSLKAFGGKETRGNRGNYGGGRSSRGSMMRTR
ncbi:outer membrane beta-barrel protein [Myroides sp. NP-2]|uniref:outer membrane beta-barrel protein n=1 Tax=Myroides sp. NP-2 TaxID=2759945 RepID=UPI0015FDC9A3|nr:outer membrane beta-barrel protein [Myroides sp. NP-2]MBB1150040.1 outer membrane beta-barrel protein [Myroides sp. NP-2]